MKKLLNFLSENYGRLTQGMDCLASGYLGFALGRTILHGLTNPVYSQHFNLEQFGEHRITTFPITVELPTLILDDYMVYVILMVSFIAGMVWYLFLSNLLGLLVYIVLPIVTAITFYLLGILTTLEWIVLSLSVVLLPTLIGLLLDVLNEIIRKNDKPKIQGDK